jgi:uncharacterized membrane protein YheB (UPF0754 family)
MTNKRCLVYETLGKVSDLQIVESTSDDGLMRLHGVFGVTGVKNNNNRIYDKKNYSQMVEALQKTIAECGCPGELEHPNSMNINLENVSHKIESIQMNEDGTITGTICLLDTPKGRIAKAIIEGGLPLYISSRAAGTMTNESGVNHVTLSTIKTYDLVGTPGFSQAKMTLKENQTLECLNESYDEGNVMYAIVEGDDLLDDSESDDSGKDDSSDKDEKKEDKKEDKKEEKDDKEKEEDKSEKKDNKNNDDKVNMNELKEAIEKLTDKVNSIEAELHVAKESLNDIPSINYEAIETWVMEEFAPKFKEELTDEINESIDDQITESLDDTVNSLAEGVQNWITKEFAPEVQNWVVEEFAPEVQNWVTEEFAPEVESWITEEFAPEVESWVTEEFAPEVQNWLVEEYSPEIQGWVTEEFAPIIDNWINEEFAPEQMEKINESVSASIETQKAGRLEEIDSLLESIAQDDNADVNKIVEEQKQENKYKGIYVVESMPAEYTPSWELLDEARQQEIIRTSKMYDFTKPGVLESFWANVDFNRTSKTENITESNNNISNYHANVLAKMKYLRRLA